MTDLADASSPPPEPPSRPPGQTLKDLLPPDRWYYDGGGELRGPVAVEVIERGVADGTLPEDTIVWHTDLPETMDLYRAGFVGDEPAPDALPRPSLLTDDAELGLGRDAGYIERALALFIDMMVMGAGMLFLSAITNVGVHLISPMGLALWAAYSAGFESSVTRATPGKMVLRNEVVNVDGTPITLRKACARFVMKLFSIVAMVITFTPPQHDTITGTRVRRI